MDVGEFAGTGLKGGSESIGWLDLRERGVGEDADGGEEDMAVGVVDAGHDEAGGEVVDDDVVLVGESGDFRGRADVCEDAIFDDEG